MATKFAAYPTALIFDQPNGKPKKQLLWGDYVALTGPASNGWQPVKSRGVAGFMAEATLTDERLLEIVFVDIGQGDGALVITPDDRHLLIDAGQEDNMYRFLRWRYNRFQQPFTFEAAVLSHPDQDHYKGFAPIFDDAKISFKSLFHSGIVERRGPKSQSLGPKSGGYLTDVTTTMAELSDLVSDPAVHEDKQYPKMLFAMLRSGRLGDARGLCTADQHLPGFTPGHSEFSIEILGPVRDQLNGKDALKWFTDVGPTKNGHSIVLRLVYRNISVLMGGDLNIPAEHHLLRWATGYSMPPSEQDRTAIIEGARQKFRSDVAKACHHGSADFSEVFLQSIDALATVISSGDDEPYSHPRADSLGGIGRWSRGNRPLIFSTELARSAPEAIKQPFVFRKQLDAAYEELRAAATEAKREKARKKVDGLLAKIERSVAVYGAINLRSDGRSIVMAQKVERPNRVDGQWDVYKIEPDAAGVLRYQSKH